MIGVVLALVMAAPAPLSVCVYGRALDPTALHDALLIEAKKVGREATVTIAASALLCRGVGSEVVVSLQDGALVEVSGRTTRIELARVPIHERPQEVARAALAALAPLPQIEPIVDEVLTPLPRMPVRRVHRRASTPIMESPSRVFAGLGLVSRGEQWLPDVELGGWLPLSTSGLALGLRFAHLPQHELGDVVKISRLELAAHVTLEARVPLVQRLGLAFQIGGGVVWRRTVIASDTLGEVVASGLGGLELRYDVAATPLYLALALQGTIFSGGHDYQTFVDDRVAPAPAAPRGAFGALIRTGARW